MKYYTLLFTLILIALVSCNKNKGCKDTEAYNYNHNPKIEDDPSMCLYENRAPETKIIYADYNGGIIDSPTSWSKIEGVEVDYYVDHIINLSSTLTIDAGVTINFGPSGGFNIRWGGALTVNGTEDEKVYFKDSSGNGWMGISSWSNHHTAKLILKHIVVENSNENIACVQLLAFEKIEFDNVIFDGLSTGGTGLILEEDQLSTTDVLINEVIIKNFTTPFITNRTEIFNFFEEINIENNENNYYIVDGVEGYSSETIFTNETSPIYFDFNIYDTSFPYFSAIPGCTFMFNNSGYNLPFHGSFNCVGTSEKPIVFKSLDGGAWSGIWVILSENPIFDNCILENATSNSSSLRVASSSTGSLIFTNSLITSNESLSCGISFSQPASSFDITGSTFINCESDICP